jgi:glycosyltransferase involved in cell wall biosynthesis
VIAERYYEARFPSAVKVLNYPRLSDQDGRCRRSETNLLYTGNVHPFRGARIHAQIPSLVDGTRVSFIGRCVPAFHHELSIENAAHWDKLEFTGIGENVPYQYIAHQYRDGAWLAGLAIFSPNQHLEKKELTKFFEYMQYGIPIIASNFPTWRKLVEDNGCGICVDPADKAAIAEAVARLRDNPELWEEMARNGIRAVHQHYSWRSQEESLLSLYEKLLS